MGRSTWPPYTRRRTRRRSADTRHSRREAATIDLGISARTQGDWTVLEVVGEVDLSSAASLRAAIEEEIGHGVRALAVDLEGVSFMDSSGLSVLVAAMRGLAEADGRFAVVCTNPSLIKVFAVTGLDRVFHLGADLDEATTA